MPWLILGHAIWSFLFVALFLIPTLGLYIVWEWVKVFGLFVVLLFIMNPFNNE